jgi:F-type H+-transporting ATPase subunit b
MVFLDYTAVYQIILFLVLWAILNKFLFRPYLDLLDERERKTSGARSETAGLEQQAERLKAEYDEKIAQAQAAGNVAKETILNEARRQRDDILESARAEASSALERVRQELASQIEKERQLAAAEAASVARDMARKILGRDVE